MGLLFPGGFFDGCCCWSECFDLRIVVPVSGNNMKLPKTIYTRIQRVYSLSNLLKNNTSSQRSLNPPFLLDLLV